MRRKIADARIDMRVTQELKYFLELAAFINGSDSLTTFIIKSSEKSAKQIFNNPDNYRNLSPGDRDLLLQFLKKAPEPNEILKAAFKKVLKLYQIDDKGRTIYKINPNLIKNAQEEPKTQGRV